MATKPIIVDQYGRSVASGGIPVHQAATYSPQRRQLWGLDKDHSQSVTGFTRTVLLQIGRELYENFTAVRGCLNEIATFATASIANVYKGEDKDWGEQASEYLCSTDDSVDIRGAPYTLPVVLRAFVVDTLVDGDIFPIFFTDSDGNPRLQTVRGHRVKGDDGFTDGVKIGQFGEKLGYRIESSTGKVEYRDGDGISHLYLPDHIDQYRGLSALATAAWDAQDVRETRLFEYIHQKAVAAIALVEKTESGDAGDDAFKRMADGGTSAAGTGIVHEELLGGMARYFRANSGAGLEVLISDRPTANQADFEKRVLRAIFASVGWPYEFGHDPAIIGGVSMRVVMEKVNTMLAHIRRNLLFPWLLKFTRFRIASAIQRGDLPGNNEWYKWAHYGPRRLTADAKNDSDVQLQEFQACFTTLAEISSGNARDWRDVIRQRVEEEEYLQTLCKEKNLNASRIMLMTPLELNPAKVQQSKAQQSAQSAQDASQPTQDSQQ